VAKGTNSFMEKGNEVNSRRFLPGQNIRICDGDGGDEDDEDDDENITNAPYRADLQRKFLRVIT